MNLAENPLSNTLLSIGGAAKAQASPRSRADAGAAFSEVFDRESSAPSARPAGVEKPERPARARRDERDDAVQPERQAERAEPRRPVREAARGERRDEVEPSDAAEVRPADAPETEVAPVEEGAETVVAADKPAPDDDGSALPADGSSLPLLAELSPAPVAETGAALLAASMPALQEAQVEALPEQGAAAQFLASMGLTAFRQPSGGDAAHSGDDGGAMGAPLLQGGPGMPGAALAAAVTAATKSGVEGAESGAPSGDAAATLQSLPLGLSRLMMEKLPAAADGAALAESADVPDFGALVSELKTAVEGLGQGARAQGAAGPLQTAAPAAATELAGKLALAGADVGAKMAEKVSWLISQQMSTARIDVDPGDMGPVQINITTQDDRLTVSFVAQHAAARDVIDQNLPRLRELLQQQGHASVDVNVSQGSPQDRRDGREPGDLAGRGQGGDADEVEGVDVRAIETRIAVARSLVDQFV